LSAQPCGSVCNEVLVAGGGSSLSILSGASTANAELFTPPPPGTGILNVGSGAAAGEVPVPDTGAASTIGPWVFALLGGTALVIARTLRSRERTRDPDPD